MGGLQQAPKILNGQMQQMGNNELSCINTILLIIGLISHSSVIFCLDSGTTCTMSVIRLDAIASKLCDKITSDTSSTPIEANGSPLDVVGQMKLPVVIGNFQIQHVFLVVSTLTVDCSFGVDCLIANEVIINYKQCNQGK